MAAAVTVVATADSEPGTCRELVELLQKKGMKVQWMKKQHKQPAVFILPEGDERNEDYMEEAIPHTDDYAIVVQLSSSSAAREAAGTRPNGFAHGRFLIYGDPEFVAKIKQHLQK